MTKQFRAEAVMPGVVQICTNVPLGPEEIKYAHLVRGLSTEETEELISDLLDVLRTARAMRD
jgi:hypothetical protein